MSSIGRLLGCVGLGLAASANAIVWDAASDFSIVSNPNGAWSYGLLNAGTFIPSTVTTTNSIFSGYLHNGQPTVMKCVAAVPSYGLQPGHLTVECDWNPSSLRFTAPFTETYTLSLEIGGYTGWQNGGIGNINATNARLLHNGVAIAEDGFINNVKIWNKTIVLNAGDTLDATLPVRYGGGNNDTMMRLEAVPEPATLTLLGGLLLGAALRRRRA